MSATTPQISHSPIQIGPIQVGGGAPLALLSGLNVLQDPKDAVSLALALREIAGRHAVPLVFKASFDKANRTRADGFRGPGLEAGLETLAAVKAESGLPVITDIHEPAQAEACAAVVDAIQIPAFLCRQTDLIAAAAATGLPLNVKKAQFLAAADLVHVVDKVAGFGGAGTMLCERGTSFGYHELVVDMRGLQTMRAFAPVCFDATHSVQQPNAAGGASSGDRSFVPTLARAAVAVGIDALFIEVHPDPDSAPVDSRCQIEPRDLDALLGQVCAMERALR